jgi:hypothetical protein
MERLQHRESKHLVLACVGELNYQLVRLNFDPDDMRVDEGCILDLGGQVEVTPNRFDDEGFNLVIIRSGERAQPNGAFHSHPSYSQEVARPHMIKWSTSGLTIARNVRRTSRVW